MLLDAWPSLTGLGDVADACAAPGNKTSHVAAGLFELGGAAARAVVHAFDKNPRRQALLSRRMQAAGAAQVQVRLADFLTLDARDESLRDVSAVLVDPSCSGSGVVRDIGRTDADSSPERLLSLHTFQVQVMLAALAFPSAEVVVYSTCSVYVHICLCLYVYVFMSPSLLLTPTHPHLHAHRYPEENESVVAELLAARPDWDVVPPTRLQVRVCVCVCAECLSLSCYFPL